MALKKIILKFKVLYEIYFFVSGKKINRKRIDSKIKRDSIKTSKIVINGLIVSLTSFGNRIPDLKYSLFSIISQSILPEKIIVWFAYGEKIPEELFFYKKFNVTFEFCDDIKSYKKLIPSLKLYSDKVIVTVDDDIFYSKKWLQSLWETHLLYPKEKICHVAHRLTFDRERNLKKYNEWDDKVSKNEGLVFPTGCGGVLYPPCKLHPDFCTKEIFMKLAPKADDVWFYFMGILQGQKSRIVSRPLNRLKYVDIYKEYGLSGKTSLQFDNVSAGLNDKQIENVINYYKIDVSHLI